MERKKAVLNNKLKCPKCGANVPSAYETAIDKLIPIAERMAKEKAKPLRRKRLNVMGKDGHKFRWDYFTEFFHEAMKELTTIAGLRVN